MIYTCIIATVEMGCLSCRMNVMLTRAKRGLIVVGHRDTLEKENCELWNQWVKHIKENNLITDCGPGLSGGAEGCPPQGGGDHAGKGRNNQGGGGSQPRRGGAGPWGRGGGHPGRGGTGPRGRGRDQTVREEDAGRNSRRGANGGGWNRGRGSNSNMGVKEEPRNESQDDGGWSEVRHRAGKTERRGSGWKGNGERGRGRGKKQ